MIIKIFNKKSDGSLPVYRQVLAGASAGEIRIHNIIVKKQK